MLEFHYGELGKLIILHNKNIGKKGRVVRIIELNDERIIARMCYNSLDVNCALRLYKALAFIFGILTLIRIPELCQAT